MQCLATLTILQSAFNNDAVAEHHNGFGQSQVLEASRAAEIHHTPRQVLTRVLRLPNVEKRHRPGPHVRAAKCKK